MTPNALPNSALLMVKYGTRLQHQSLVTADPANSSRDIHIVLIVAARIFAISRSDEKFPHVAPGH
jgi:hypothetical protein